VGGGGTVRESWARGRAVIVPNAEDRQRLLIERSPSNRLDEKGEGKKQHDPQDVGSRNDPTRTRVP